MTLTVATSNSADQQLSASRPLAADVLPLLVLQQVIRASSDQMPSADDDRAADLAAQFASASRQRETPGRWTWWR